MEQIAELFLMILMGYIIVKTGLLKGEDSKVISKIVLYLVIPVSYTHLDVYKRQVLGGIG